MQVSNLLKDRLETTTNIAVIVTVVVFLAFVGQQEYDRRHSSVPPSQAPLVGQMITLPGVHFPSQRRTIVLALSTTCHFCKDSEPFYRQLANENLGSVKIVAVLPQPSEEAKSYVEKSISPSVQVISSRLDLIGVGGTPTLLLLDGNGKVQKARVGRLSDQGQKEVQALVM